VAILKRFSVLILFASLCLAQVATSRLDGVVVDESGAVIPGAKITVLNERTQARTEATTNQDGLFVLPSLQPGIYTVTAEAKGFRKAIVNAVELNVSVAVTQRFKLEVGQVTESVVVEAEAVRVQTTDAQLGRSVTLRDIDTLPQLGRNPVILAVFSPGVQLSNPGDTTFANVNGQRQGANNTTLDGIDVNDAVVPRLGLSMTANNTDSVGEIRIVTNGAKAEYGRNAGGQVEMVTRSGTNTFHGNAFDYLRNTELNANNFFNNTSGVKRPKYIQNLFGGSVGGPVVKNKIFFFFNYQGSRVAQDVTRNRTVYSPLAKQGIFQWRAPGSTTVQQFNIAANDPRKLGIDPQMAAIFKLLPDPNNADIGDGLNTMGFRFNNPAGSRNNQFTGKADYNFKDNHHLFFRYSWFRTYSIDSLNSADATYPGLPQGWQGGTRVGFSAGSDWMVTPSIVNELRVGHQSANVQFARPGRLQGPTIITNLITDPNLPNFPQGRNSPVTEITDYVTKLKGNHTFKAGANIRITEQWGYNEAGANYGIYPNIYTSTGNGNTVPANIGPSGSAISSANRQTFESMYNDVLGRPSNVGQSFFSDLAAFQAPGTARIRDFWINEQSYFFQDDWKVRRNLTLNLGLRWEFSGLPSEAGGFSGGLDKVALINTVSQISNLTVAKGQQWYAHDWNNFAPRLGFAYDLKGDGKTAIRGGVGMFYDRFIGATISSVDGGTPGFGLDLQTYPNQTAGSDMRINEKIPMPQQPTAPVLTLPANRGTASATVFDPNMRTPYVMQFNLNVQRELMRNTVLEVSYVGSRGIKLFMNYNPNQRRVYGDFLNSFKELQAYQANPSTAVSPSNTLVKIFGTPAAAISSLGASNFTQGQVGAAANTLDTNNYTRYAAAGVSDYYIRNYPQYQNLYVGTNSGRSYYNSLQVSVRRTMGALKVFGNYTWAKSIDNGSVEGNGYTAPFDSYNLILNRGRSDFDRAQSFNGSVAYILPVGKGKKFGGSMPLWLDSVIGGWEVGSLVIWQSGSVYTITSSRATTWGGTTWANYSGSRNIGEVSRQGDGVWYYPKDLVNSFSFPGAGDTGNAGRNTFRGPRYFDVDLSLVKRFRIWERHFLTFRVESYNAFNNVNFANPTVTLTTPATFGKFGSIVGNPRIYQMAMRYDF
jgi:hypothetical protein